MNTNIQSRPLYKYIKSHNLYSTQDYYTGLPRFKEPNSNGTFRIAQQIDVADILQAAQKQGPMRIRINQMNWLGPPYPQDAHDDVHVRTQVSSL